MSKQTIDSSEIEKIHQTLFTITAQLSQLQSEIASNTHAIAFLTKVVAGAGKAPAKTVTTPIVEQPATTTITTPVATQTAPVATQTAPVATQAAPVAQKALNIKLYFNAVYDGAIKNKSVEVLIANAKNAMSPEDKEKLEKLAPAKQRDAMYNIVKSEAAYVAAHEAYKKGTADNTAKNE